MITSGDTVLSGERRKVFSLDDGFHAVPEFHIEIASGQYGSGHTGVSDETAVKGVGRKDIGFLLCPSSEQKSFQVSSSYPLLLPLREFAHGIQSAGELSLDGLDQRCIEYREKPATVSL